MRIQPEGSDNMDLRLNTTQKLALSQQMVLSAKILQMSSVELNDYLKDLSQNNPVIDYDEKTFISDSSNNIREKLEWIESADEQNRIYYDDDREDESINKNFATSEETFEDHLLIQIRTQKLKPEIKLAAEFAVKSLDENGYLHESAKTISCLTGINNEDTQKAIDLIYTLDPIGTGAKNLKHCLLLQLLAEDTPNETAMDIVRYHLDDLAKNRLKAIATALDVSLNTVIESSKKIKSLNPKPSRGFPSKDSPGFVFPDACIYKTPSGEYEAALSDFYSPSLKISSYYKNILKSEDNPEALEYINEKLNQAQWVLKCINRRNVTVISTINIITKLQKPFFDNGVKSLVPMTLSDISSRLDIHESTVSRAVRDKYIQCSWGVFPLSYFFSAPVVAKSCSGEALDVSRNSIKLRIKELISAEDKKHPLSDRVISEVLEKEGISVSRRTVAKYRESMDIAGASVRKDF